MLVDALDAEHAHAVAGLVGGERRGRELVLGHLAEVPDHVRTERAERVRTHRDLEDVDARELVAVLLDVVRDAPRHVDRDRDRAERVVARVVEAFPELVRRDVQQLRQVVDDALGLVAEILPVHRDDHAHPVVDEHASVRVLDHAALRGRLDQPHGVVVRGGLVLLGREDLEEPEPRGERGEQHDDERHEHLDPHPGPRLGHAGLTTVRAGVTGSPRPPGAATGTGAA